MRALIDTNVLHDTMKLQIDACRNAIRNPCTVCSVPSCSKAEIETAVNDIGFKDFEDSFQNVCAAAVSADYIITRNKKDFMPLIAKKITKDFYDISKVDALMKEAFPAYEREKTVAPWRGDNYEIYTLNDSDGSVLKLCKEFENVVDW